MTLEVKMYEQRYTEPMDRNERGIGRLGGFPAAVVALVLLSIWGL